MSIKSSDSHVESVSGAVVAGLAIGGAMLAATIIANAARSLNNVSRKAYTDSLTSLPSLDKSEIKSVTTLHTKQNELLKLGVLKTAVLSLDAVEAAKVKALASFSATPYFVSEHTALEQSLLHLQNAKTVQEVTHAKRLLVNEFGVGHSRILTQSVMLACNYAALKIGFSNVQTEIVPDGTTRVIVVDPAGRALVTEINTDKNYDVTIATEVVGVSDGSCSSLLDSFNEALVNEGIRRTPGKRSFTGGVCELAAARDFIRRKFKPKTIAQQQSNIATDSNTATRRSQRLNNQTRQKQR